MISIQAKYLALLLLILCSTARSANAVSTLTFAFVGEANTSAFRGIQQGLDEARLQGQFTGKDYALEMFESAELLPDTLDKFIAILVAADKNQLLAVRDAAPGHPVFNLVNENDALRRSCHDNLLHIIASERMKKDAVVQWQHKHPGSAVQAHAWHGDFVKYAARDLNKRYKKSFGEAMDDYAWAGWAAVKMTSDATARNQISQPADMLHFLKSGLAFDGQKGLTMTFRETGQLRQLMLLVDDGKLLGEAPVRGVSEDIDSLGISTCGS